MAALSVPVQVETETLPVQLTYPDLVRAFLASKTKRTVEAYRQDLADFKAFLNAPDVETAARQLLSWGHGRANKTALDYRTHLVERGLAPATINRRLAALRSMVKLARTMGMVSWSLEVPSVKSERYRDTRGCGLEGFRLLLQAAQAQKPEKAARDTALLWLLYSPALRRAEVCSLDLEDLELDSGRVWVKGKARSEKEPVTLPPPTVKALEAWIELLGDQNGPLFCNLSRAHERSQLTPKGLWSTVRTLGKKAGLGEVWPHQLRHAGITAALDATNDVRAVQRFSRHRDIRVLQLYDDNRQDLGGEVARAVAANVEV